MIDPVGHGNGDHGAFMGVVVGANGPAMEMAEAIGLGRRLVSKRRKGRPSCVDCFFHCQMLCALDLDEPCSTFRPNSDDGLVPPRQPALLLRQAPDERAVRAA
ncbi:MAG TPA: hypothetical protein VKA47_03740 [Solirubrobacterales bacterium]|nr:hypothetical protein [Solirubrobacterales bacterium]